MPILAGSGARSGKVNPNMLYADGSYQSRFDGGGFACPGKAGLRVN
jgi:hypothetical protein